MSRFVDQLERELVEAAERIERPSARGLPRLAATPRRLAQPLALAVTVLAVLAVAAALPIALLGSGGGRSEELAAPPPPLQGEFSSPLEGAPELPPQRGAPRRSTLTVTGSRYKLTSGIYGLLGDVRANAETIQFRSPTGYFKLPGLSSASSPSPDPKNRCPGVSGLYRWTRAGRQLILSVVRDQCAGRRRQLTSATWTARQ